MCEAQGFNMVAGHGCGVHKQRMGRHAERRLRSRNRRRQACREHECSRQAVVAHQGDGLGVQAAEPPLAPPAIAAGVLAIEHRIMRAPRSFFLTAPGEGH